MFTEDQLKQIHSSRLAGESHFFEREAYLLTEAMLYALEQLANYADFALIPDAILAELL